MTSRITNPVSLKTVRRNSSQTFDWRRYINKDHTCEVAKQRKRVSGGVALYAELRTNVLRAKGREMSHMTRLTPNSGKWGEAH